MKPLIFLEGEYFMMEKGIFLITQQFYYYLLLSFEVFYVYANLIDFFGSYFFEKKLTIRNT